MTLRTPNTGARSLGARWQRIPSGSATMKAAVSEPNASHTCCRASRAKRSAFTVYSRITERLSKVPCASARPATPMKSARNSTLEAGPGERRVMASVARSPRQVSSTHTAAPGATRTTRLPAGVSASAAAPRASATATTPRSAAVRRTRAFEAARAARAARARIAWQANAPQPGNAASMATGSPGRIRFGFKTTKGSSTSAAAPRAVSSAPSGSRRGRRGTASARRALTSRGPSPGGSPRRPTARTRRRSARAH